MTPHCTKCGTAGYIADEGCGDPSCCDATWCLECNCAGGEVCSLEGDNSDCQGCRTYNEAFSTPQLAAEGAPRG